jgi:hypothetical protein
MGTDAGCLAYLYHQFPNHHHRADYRRCQHQDQQVNEQGQLQFSHSFSSLFFWPVECLKIADKHIN